MQPTKTLDETAWIVGEPPSVPPAPALMVASIIDKGNNTGKTTLAANLAAGLARDGLSVIAVDIDPQGDLATRLGLPMADSTRAFLMDSPGRDLMPLLTETGRERLRIIAGNQRTVGADNWLRDESRSEFGTADFEAKIMALRTMCDVVVFDMPTRGWTRDLIAAMCDVVIVPTGLTLLPVKAALSLVKRVEKSNPAAHIVIQPNADNGATGNNEGDSELRAYLGDRHVVINPSIPRTTWFDQLENAQATVWEQRPLHPNPTTRLALQRYDELVAQIQARLALHQALHAGKEGT